MSLELKKPFTLNIPFIINETVEKDGKRQYQEVARMNMPVPLLSDFGITAEIEKDEKGADKYEDGIPVFVDSAMDWLQFAIVQQVKAQNRNKFINGKLKEGAKLPECFEELVAVGERNGEALKARHECRTAFGNYLKAQNKKELVVKLMSNLLVDADSIAICEDKFANALEGHIAGFIGSLNDEQKLRFTKTLDKAIDALASRKEMLNEGL